MKIDKRFSLRKDPYRLMRQVVADVGWIVSVLECSCRCNPPAGEHPNLS